MQEPYIKVGEKEFIEFLVAKDRVKNWKLCSSTQTTN